MHSPRVRRAGVALAVVAVAVLVGGVVAATTVDGGAPDVEPPAAAATTAASTSTAPPRPSTTVATTTTTSTSTTTSTTSTTSAPAVTGDVLLVWTSGGLPDGFVDDVRSIPGVRDTTVGVGGQGDLVESRDADGRVVQRFADRWTIPIDVVGIDPVEYARFRPSIATALDVLTPGTALLTETSSGLRGVGVGGTIALRTGAVTIVGIVPDVPGAGAELLIHGADADRLGVATERFLYVADTDRASTERAIRDVTPAGAHLSLRPSSAVTWLRHGDRVEPKIIVKRRFGEFAYRDGNGRSIEMDPEWVAANIRTEAVPVLGEIRCHRDVIPEVRAVMQALVDAGRSDAVDPADYAGCWNPRRIGASSSISHHAWGIALDINVGSNPRGDFATQDQVLADAFEARGFSWGGRWEYPDPAHYEAAPSVTGEWPS